MTAESSEDQATGPMQDHGAAADRPRFARFAAAMDEARATGAPVTRLYEGPEPVAPAVPDQTPARWPPAMGLRRRPVVPTQVGTPGGIPLRWVGAAGCAVLFAALATHWTLRTDVAETAQLFGARFAPVARVAEPPADPSVSVPPAPGHETPVAMVEAPSAPTATPPLPPAEAAATPGAGDRPAGFPPLPRFKPAAPAD